MKVGLAIALAALAVTTTAHAQAKGAKIPLYVNCEADPSDLTGVQLCSALRDTIARSPRYELRISTEGDYFEVRVINMAPKEMAAGVTVSSVAMTLESKDSSEYMTSWVMLTGSDKVASQASYIVAAIDDKVDWLFKNVRKS